MQNNFYSEKNATNCEIDVFGPVRETDESVKFPVAISKAMATARAGNCSAPFESDTLNELAEKNRKGSSDTKKISGRSTNVRLVRRSRPATLIKKALEQAKIGNVFAVFAPQVLDALALEYIKGPAAWQCVVEQFKGANKHIPMNELNKAMRNILAPSEDRICYLNYAMILGEALAAAKAGDARAPYADLVLEAQIALQTREEDHPSNLRRSFKRANQNISLTELDDAIRDKLWWMWRLSPWAGDVQAAMNYVWDRPSDDSVGPMSSAFH